MVSQRRRKSRKSPLMGSHQRCWLWGRHVVVETLRAGRWPIVELRVDRELDFGETKVLAADRGIPVITEPASRLTQICGASDHQGVLAKMRPFPYRALDDILTPHKQPRSLVMLDRIQDPYNFGAVIRAADVLGIEGVIVGNRQQAEVNSLVARSSAGAVNHVPIARVPELVDAADELRHCGYQFLAADSTADRTLSQADLSCPTVVVLGNEGAGVSHSLIERCDAVVTIPQFGHVNSLNVAVAAGIFFYEIQRQRTGTSPERGAS